jgi:hypothetical protein
VSSYPQATPYVRRILQAPVSIPPSVIPVRPYPQATPVAVQAGPFPEGPNDIPSSVVPAGPHLQAAPSVAVPAGPILQDPSTILSVTADGVPNPDFVIPILTVTPAAQVIVSTPSSASLVPQERVPSPASLLANTSLAAPSLAYPASAPLITPFLPPAVPLLTDPSTASVTAPASGTVLANTADLSGPIARPRRVHLIVSAPQQPGPIQDTMAIGHGPTTAASCVDAHHDSGGADIPDATGGQHLNATADSVTCRRSGRLAGKR